MLPVSVALGPPTRLNLDPLEMLSISFGRAWFLLGQSTVYTVEELILKLIYLFLP